MNIYLVQRTDGVDYDEYAGFICVAESEESALKICEDAHGSHGENGENDWGSWPRRKTVAVTLIGNAVDWLEPGIIFDDFRAG